ncbi:hypothetical protein [Methanopyrus kandleri]
MVEDSSLSDDLFETPLEILSDILLRLNVTNRLEAVAGAFLCGFLFGGFAGALYISMLYLLVLSWGMLHKSHGMLADVLTLLWFGCAFIVIYCIPCLVWPLRLILERVVLFISILWTALAFSLGVLAAIPLVTLFMMITSLSDYTPQGAPVTFTIAGVLLDVTVYGVYCGFRFLMVRNDPVVRFYLEYRREFGYPRPENAPTWDEVLPIASRSVTRLNIVLRHYDYVQVFGRRVCLESFLRFLDLREFEDPDGDPVEGAQKLLALIALAARGEAEEWFWRRVNELIVIHGLVELYYVLSRLARLEYDHPEVELARYTVEGFKGSILGPLAGTVGGGSWR